MSEERRDAPAGGPEEQAQVKVNDRRRFRPDGDAIVREEGGEAPEQGAAPATAEPRQDEQLAAQAAKIDELTRAYAALVEDNKAFRQRLDRERARVVEAERVGVIQALLESADDLERALAAVSGVVEAQGDALGNLVEGVRLSLGALHKRIATLGAQRIPVIGQPFDPHVAEAVDTVAVADAAQDGVVLHEIRPGYRIGDRILRPARVRVGRLARA
ncbi:nucleotide exchange factor GrpE [Anaeromyxobacter oryzisoli]|uniref:nucleotide exchange factor GrpE n=1 Tax=Anaeromyxobacter oryzisoli TaxID=2925408 RepID=UPI001F596B11|nr:nucleotide exchange factor GrpE [Anaeromyxobacter sp. SG63]